MIHFKLCKVNIHSPLFVMYLRKQVLQKRQCPQGNNTILGLFSKHRLQVEALSSGAFSSVRSSIFKLKAISFDFCCSTKCLNAPPEGRRTLFLYHLDFEFEYFPCFAWLQLSQTGILEYLNDCHHLAGLLFVDAIASR